MPPKGKSHWLVQTEREHIDGYHWAWLFSMTPSSRKGAGDSSHGKSRSTEVVLLVLDPADSGKARKRAHSHQCPCRSPPAIALPCHQVLVAITILIQVGSRKASSLRGQQPQRSFTYETNQRYVLLSQLFSLVSNRRSWKISEQCRQQYLHFTNKTYILLVLSAIGTILEMLKRCQHIKKSKQSRV